MKKRTLVKITAFTVAFLVAVTAFAVIARKEINSLKSSVRNSYSANLYELDGSMASIGITLKKAVYSSSPTQFGTLAAELATESTVAKNSLSRLPSSGQARDGVNKFLSQVGDYTVYLSKKLISGEKIEIEERQNLNRLSAVADELSRSIEAVRMKFDSDGRWADELNEMLNEDYVGVFGESSEELERLLADYPTLIYDGPFSDHMLKGNLKMLEGAVEFSADEAKARASETLGTEQSSLRLIDESDGNMPCFVFENGDMTVSVTRQGGYIAYMRKYRAPTAESVDYESAVKIAEDYLNNKASQSFVSTYYLADEGVCTVNLVHKEGATLCYPDLIKVGVALDNGEVVFVEAAGYLANHYTRTIETPKYSADEAKHVLSDSLKVQGIRRAVIPTSGNSERHCYEFKCEGLDGEELLVYINVMTLEEESILILLSTDGGTLTE